MATAMLYPEPEEGGKGKKGKLSLQQLGLIGELAMANPTPATAGVDHVGLSVRNLESTRRTASGGMSSVSGLTIPPSSSPTAA